MATDPAKPLLSINNQSNISFSAFRIVPAALQSADVPTVEVKNSQLVISLGNVIEAKGGNALHFEVTSNMAIFGNAFPQGKQKAVVCKSSSSIMEANAYLGAWPQAVAVDTGCNIKILRNLFLENQIAIATSSQTESIEVRNNTFLKNLAAMRFFGDVPAGAYADNIFFQNAYALFGSKDYSGKKIGRNSYFKSPVSFKGKSFKGLEMELAQPIFEIPDQYDFRLKSNSALIGAASTSDAEGNRLDFGAYQRTDCAGRWNGQLLTSIAAAVGEKKLATGCPSR